MKQIFIRVQAKHGKIDLNIMNSTAEQREEYYNSLGKGQIMSLLEIFIEDKMMEENRK